MSDKQRAEISSAVQTLEDHKRGAINSRETEYRLGSFANAEEIARLMDYCNRKRYRKSTFEDVAEAYLGQKTSTK